LAQIIKLVLRRICDSLSLRLGAEGFLGRLTSSKWSLLQPWLSLA